MHSHIAGDSVAHSLSLPELAAPIHPVRALSRSGFPVQCWAWRGWAIHSEVWASPLSSGSLQGTRKALFRS